MMLAADSEMEVAGDCTGVAAPELIERTRPDILFLDVQMPEMDGFELLEAIGIETAPVVVFVTAYDKYALQACEVHAIDYLLKPFDDARFARALRRAKQQARARKEGKADAALQSLMRERAAHRRRFLIRTRGKAIAVSAEDIDWIEAADYYVSIHVRGTTHLLRETMADLESQLDPDRFVRVHRSAIVNIDRVREVHPLFRGDSILILADGSRVKLARTRREEFTRRFSPPSGRR
jgi:two-component system LytT family response regulator